MKINKVMPLYEMAEMSTGGGSGVLKDGEFFDFGKVTDYRLQLEKCVDACIAELNNGSAHIQSAFDGQAMHGGSANAIKNVWDELVKKMNKFNTELFDRIDKAKIVGLNNEEFERQAKAIFEGAGSSTSDTYGNM